MKRTREEQDAPEEPVEHNVAMPVEILCIIYEYLKENEYEEHRCKFIDLPYEHGEYQWYFMPHATTTALAMTCVRCYIEFGLLLGSMNPTKISNNASIYPQCAPIGKMLSTSSYWCLATGYIDESAINQKFQEHFYQSDIKSVMGIVALHLGELGIIAGGFARSQLVGFLRKHLSKTTSTRHLWELSENTYDIDIFIDLMSYGTQDIIDALTAFVDAMVQFGYTPIYSTSTIQVITFVRDGSADPIIQIVCPIERRYLEYHYADTDVSALMRYGILKTSVFDLSCTKVFISIKSELLMTHLIALYSNFTGIAFPTHGNAYLELLPCLYPYGRSMTKAVLMECEAFSSPRSKEEVKKSIVSKSSASIYRNSKLRIGTKRVLKYVDRGYRVITSVSTSIYKHGGSRIFSYANGRISYIWNHPELHMLLKIVDEILTPSNEDFNTSQATIGYMSREHKNRGDPVSEYHIERWKMIFNGIVDHDARSTRSKNS